MQEHKGAYFSSRFDATRRSSVVVGGQQHAAHGRPCIDDLARFRPSYLESSLACLPANVADLLRTVPSSSQRHGGTLHVVPTTQECAWRGALDAAFERWCDEGARQVSAAGDARPACVAWEYCGTAAPPSRAAVSAWAALATASASATAGPVNPTAVRHRLDGVQQAGASQIEGPPASQVVLGMPGQGEAIAALCGDIAHHVTQHLTVACVEYAATCAPRSAPRAASARPPQPTRGDAGGGPEAGGAAGAGSSAAGNQTPGAFPFFCPPAGATSVDVHANDPERDALCAIAMQCTDEDGFVAARLRAAAQAPNALDCAQLARGIQQLNLQGGASELTPAELSLLFASAVSFFCRYDRLLAAIASVTRLDELAGLAAHGSSGAAHASDVHAPQRVTVVLSCVETRGTWASECSALPQSVAFVRCPGGELGLLAAFAALTRLVDADVLCGFETQKGSLGFVLSRAGALRIGLAEHLGRTVRKQTMNQGVRTDVMRSREQLRPDEVYSYRQGQNVTIPGRVVLNLWRVLRKDVRLPIYTLHACARFVLQRRLPFFGPQQLSVWLRDESQRWRAYDYAVLCASATMDLIAGLDVIGRTSELARVFGVDFTSVHTRGSQFRVESMMVRLAHPQGYVMLTPSRHDVAQQRAAECSPLIFEPVSRLHPYPVLVLDFQSLYPSQVIARNICFSTCLGELTAAEEKRFGVASLAVPLDVLERVREQVSVTPNRMLFVTPSVRSGVLPRMLNEILSTRIMVKAVMKEIRSSNMALHRLLDYRQMGLKMIANVTYGYTAASFSGRMPCVDVADSIVQSGRDALERAIKTAEGEWHAQVIYGDTDSIFVALPGATLDEAFRAGREIAKRVTSLNKVPVELQFEKVFMPCVLLAKKRYCGYRYDAAGAKPVLEGKGIEIVRRDTCPAVQKVMSRVLTMLFERGDLSAVKTYVQRQFAKIVAGRVNVWDFVFAKEVRMGSYSHKAAPPPAAVVGAMLMAEDVAAMPRYKERVPYVVVCGEPGARLVDLVVPPRRLLQSNGRLRLNAVYYITKQIVPALDRVLALVGVDIKQWFNEMPRNLRRLASTARASDTAGAFRLAGRRGVLVNRLGNATLEQFYLSIQCPVCGALAKSGLCTVCARHPQEAAYALLTRAHKLERKAAHVRELCRDCMHAPSAGDALGAIECESLDCPLYYERYKTSAELAAHGAHLAGVLLERETGGV